MDKPVFFEATEPTPEYLNGINALLPQLSTTATAMSMDDLAQLTASDNTRLFFVSVAGRIVGMTTLAIYRIPTGCRAWVEDVVVDSEFRGMQLGRLLIEKTIEVARRLSPCTLMLTSRPSRVAANKLYQSIGFQYKETNAYKMSL